MHLIAANVADSARDHDRLVITAIFAADLHLERAKVTTEIRASELVVERRSADRSVEHDRQRRRDPVRLADRRFPRLKQRRDPQMRDAESHETGFRLRAGTGRAFIANFSTG